MKLSFMFLMLVGATACNSQVGNSTGLLNPTGSQNGSGASSSSIESATSTSALPTASSKPSPTATSVNSASLSGEVGLVWNGDGACDDQCALAGANAVTSAGLTVRYVNGDTKQTTQTDIDAIFANARIWVMPGGYASNELAAMSTALKQGIVNFVSQGGGYVGWCAGAFAATTSVGTIGKPGLGIFPGNTVAYTTSNKQNSYGASIGHLTWLNGTRYMYLEGGPYFANLPSSVEVIGRYDDQVSPAAARTTYGSGRVYLSGPHPDAPTWWWQGTTITDPDGSDATYATDMVKWAASLE